MSPYDTPFPEVLHPDPAGQSDSPRIQSTIATLHLRPNIEGGYFVETDRNFTKIPNPFLDAGSGHQSSLAVTATTTTTTTTTTTKTLSESENQTRDTSTSIFYLLTPGNPIGHFHRNRGRTIHVHHRGRARYVIIHADEAIGTGKKARIEWYDVGPKIEKGERLQWVVEGGKFKASFLLPDDGEGEDDGEGKGEGKGRDRQSGPKSEGGCLITEVVTPGFEYADHDFMERKTLEELVSPEDFELLEHLLRKGERPTEAELDTKLPQPQK